MFRKLVFYSDKVYRVRWVRIMFRSLAILLFCAGAAYLGLAAYIYHHKKEVLQEVVDTLNESLSGSLEIGSMEPTFITGFPRVSIRLNNVVLKDSLFKNHGHTVVKAQLADLTVNTLALLRGTILVKKITLRNAAVDLFTDASGYSNTMAFKKKAKGRSRGEGNMPELKKISLDNVSITINNLLRQKLYKFKVDELHGEAHNTLGGWDAEVWLDTKVHSLSFNTARGSFIGNQQVTGKIDFSYTDDTEQLRIKPNKLKIGKENFIVGALIKLCEPDLDFAINIENKRILWSDAANLLTNNISTKLMMFNLKRPIHVKCDLIGGFNVAGEPLIRVNAFVRNNTLSTPGGIVDKCRFFGVFTNEYIKGKGYTDENSVIKLFNFKGNYADIPLDIPQAQVVDLKKPVAMGRFKSNFNVSKLNNLVDNDLIIFSKGKADVNLTFRADIVNFKLSKPFVEGAIKIKDATVQYAPRGLKFNDINVNLDFTKDNLYISRINLKTPNSNVQMQGQIKNFLNLYYTAPEKVVLDWEVYSPHLNLGDFMAFVGSRKASAVKTKAANKTGNFTNDIDVLFDRSNVDMKLRVDKLYYKNFDASGVRADILLTNDALVIKNAAVKHADGVIKVDGIIQQGRGERNNYNVNAVVANVNISKFFRAFENFGIESLKAENIRGFLSSKAKITGLVADNGAMVPHSMDGTLGFTLKNGALLNFEPVQKVGRLAFPNRDMKNITFSSLNGRFNINGEKVVIHPMQISSSVLNMDVEGIYSFGAGTSIQVDVPIRNPKRDEGITDKQELAKRRNRGIVLHLVAEDDKDGKVKVKLGKREEDD